MGKRKGGRKIQAHGWGRRRFLKLAIIGGVVVSHLDSVLSHIERVSRWLPDEQKVLDRLHADLLATNEKVQAVQLPNG